MAFYTGLNMPVCYQSHECPDCLTTQCTHTCFGHPEDFADGTFLPVQGEADPPEGAESRALPLELLETRRGLVVLVHRFQHLTVRKFIMRLN